MNGYDQWKTANPQEYDEDPIEFADEVLKELSWAKLNWEERPGKWIYHLERLELCINELLGYIEENC